MKRCAEIPGHELFKYLDDDEQPRTVDSGDVNAYIKDITGEDFSAKDFRTWAGTVLAALALTEFKKYDSQAEAKRNVVAAIESVSKQLGNTPAMTSFRKHSPSLVHGPHGDALGARGAAWHDPRAAAAEERSREGTDWNSQTRSREPSLTPPGGPP